MQSQLVNIFLLSLVSMFNPTPLAAVTVMLLLPSAKRLMFGYLLGAYTASITVGLVIVFALHSSSVTSTAKHTLSPAEDIVVGVIAVLIAFVLATGRDKPFEERRREKKDAKAEAKAKAGKPGQSLPLRMLGKGDPRLAFVVGAILSFPGVSYLAALNRIHKLNPGTVERTGGRRLLPDRACSSSSATRLRVRAGVNGGPDNSLSRLDGHPRSCRCRDWWRCDRGAAAHEGSDQPALTRIRKSVARILSDVWWLDRDASP
jgi:hypothetical protein